MPARGWHGDAVAQLNSNVCSLDSTADPEPESDANARPIFANEHTCTHASADDDDVPAYFTSTPWLRVRDWAMDSLFDPLPRV